MPASMIVHSSSDAHRDIDALHDLCGVYTKRTTVNRILDLVSWKATKDLSKARLLEPAAGDGAFLVVAVARLLDSLTNHGYEITIDSLRNRIRAFELVPEEAEKARQRVVSRLTAFGLHHLTARACARAWVKSADFLLADLTPFRFSHVVGNPPYVRWSKVPTALRTAYACQLPKDIAKGDLCLPFLDRSFEYLAPEGKCGFVCSDRWRYAGYGDGFRQRWLPLMDITTYPAGEPKDVFRRDVYVYPDIVVASRRQRPRRKAAKPRRRGQTLAELGCTIRVGPALGVMEAFLLKPGDDEVEAELLHPWIDTRDVERDRVVWSGRRVIIPFDKDGAPIDLSRFPILAARFHHFKERLEGRYIVRNGATWYRTIDKIRLADWSAPKLLIPELAKVPRVAIDRSGAVPSHGIYCIFSHERDIEEVYDRLRDGKLARAIGPLAPKVKGSYVRCYRRFLAKMEI